jgi:hypothetical protein
MKNQGTSAAKSNGKAHGVLRLAEFQQRWEEYCWIVTGLIFFDDFLLVADRFSHESGRKHYG